jgi:hypothetical protein
MRADGARKDAVRCVIWDARTTIAYPHTHAHTQVLAQP